MLANIDKQIVNARIELESLKKNADVRLAQQRRAEQLARHQHEQQMRHQRMLQMRNRVNFARYADAMRQVAAPPNPPNEIMAKKQSFLRHALHQIETEIGQLRAAQNHALELETSLKQHRTKMLEQQMALQERRCDFLEALKSLQNSSVTNVPSNSAPYRSEYYHKPAHKMSGTTSSSTVVSSRSPTPSRGNDAKRFKATTVDLSKDDDVDMVAKPRGATPPLTHEVTPAAACTPPLTPEASSETTKEMVSALSMLGDLAARLTNDSPHSDKSLLSDS